MSNLKIETWRNPAKEYSVSVYKWLYSEAIREQYFEHPYSLWLLWNYIKKIGICSVIRKLKSRFAESVRNEKVFGVGLGVVLDTPYQSEISQDEEVLFFAYNHSPHSKNVCLNEAFVCPISKTKDMSCSVSQSANVAELINKLSPYIGWSPFAGIPVDIKLVRNSLADYAKNVPKDTTNSFSVEKNFFTVRKEVLNVVPLKSKKPSAVLFGLGNYAKTAILPNIKPYISLHRVHEIDPDQLNYFGKRPSVSVDTSPYPRPNLKFDVWFIAGFHHTHTELGIKALAQGAYAVIEKPLATTKKQYCSFLNAVFSNKDSRFFLCFHKRYSELHSFAVRDLKLRKDEPVNIHCIVYEVPLPKYHWYNWPNSGSRLISNGCHWIDYFMYVNSYSPAVDYRVWRLRDTDVCVQVMLENGAYMVMSLTDKGSQRLGVRDYIELRKGGITIKMIDASYYEAENRNRIFMKKKVNPSNAYKLMYKNIAKTIANDGIGDSEESLRSSELVVNLEEAFQQELLRKQTV